MPVQLYLTNGYQWGMMDTITGSEVKNVFVVLNPVAGNSNGNQTQEQIETRFNELGWQFRVYETNASESVAEVVGEACKSGANLIIAAGGDGTVAGVVNGLMHSGVLLGIIPVGTGNGLARALSIPLDVSEAIDLISGPHHAQPIDALQVNDDYYLLNVSVGISSRSMKNTGHEQKQRFGMAAYARTILKEVIGVTPRRFDLEVDGHSLQVRATEILVANGSILQTPTDLFGSAESFADGEVEAHILTARSLRGYLRLGWQLLSRPKGRKDDLRRLKVRERISIDSVRKPQPVQADGELIGQTPVEIRVVPRALRVIVPESDDQH